jgi:glutamine phosphoribosylpyrophosphate amidotransferase
MCGIFLLASGPPLFPEDVAPLFAANSPRGNRQHGLLTVGHEGWQAQRWDRPFKSLTSMYSGATLVAGHVRAPTSGVTDPSAIHPLETKDFLFAHNGLLIETPVPIDYAECQGLPPIDSSTIVQSIQDLVSLGHPLVPSIVQTLERCNGQQACWLFEKKTRAIYYWRVMSSLWWATDWLKATISSEPVGNPKYWSPVPQGVLYRIPWREEFPQKVDRFDFESPYDV